MKILEAGVAVFSYVFRCSSCESKCEADGSDLIYSPGGADPRGDSWEESFAVQCGVCRATVQVPNGQIPPLVKIQVREEARATTRSTQYGR